MDAIAMVERCKAAQDRCGPEAEDTMLLPLLVSHGLRGRQDEVPAHEWGAPTLLPEAESRDVRPLEDPLACPHESD